MAFQLVHGGSDWVKWLTDAGIIREGEHVTRVIIDLQVAHPPRIMVSRLAETKITDFPLPNLDGLTVTVVDGT